MHTNAHSYRGYGLSHTGMVRRSNQDAFWIDSALGIVTLADGVGGLPGGAKASKRAIDFIRGRAHALASGQCHPHELVQGAHAAVRSLGKQISPELGIGTTLSIGVLRNQRLELAHVGDCVVYHWRLLKLTRLSESHVSKPITIKNKVVRGGERLERFLGQPAPLEVQTLSLDLIPGDWILLVSDGLTKTVDDEEIAAVMRIQNDPRKLCEALIVTSNNRGGPDNTTAVAITIDPHPQNSTSQCGENKALHV
jgi:serine/threonine protein phosphatase PrpC